HRDLAARRVPSPRGSRAAVVPERRHPPHRRGRAGHGRRDRRQASRSGARPALSAMTERTSLWANRDLARAYAEVRTGLSPAARAVWTDALRAAIPSTPLRRLPALRR